MAITKPIVGDTTNAWGTVLNTALDLLDARIATLEAMRLANYGYPLTTGESTLDRIGLSTVSTAANSGQMILTYFNASKTETNNSVIVPTAAAGVVTPTLVRVGVYSVVANNLTLISSSVNDITKLIAAYTRYTMALTTPWAKVAGARYAIGVLQVCATAATFAHHGVAASGVVADNLLAESPRISGTVDGLADLPASVLAGSVIVTRKAPVYMEVTP